jgi:dienelactone hydrolase
VEQTILALLKNKDPQQRKQGILQAGRSGNPVYIKPLTQLSYTESDLDLRILAEKAIQHLRKQSDQAVTTKETQRPVVMPKPRNQRYTGGGMVSLIAFTILVIGVIGLIIYLTRGSEILNVFQQQQLQSRYSNPAEFPLASTAPATLTGQVYRSRIDDLMYYYVQEPSGTPPPDGWPLLVAIHGWQGDAFSMIAPFSQRAYDEGVILVTPSYNHQVEVSYDDYYAVLSILLDDVRAYYPINQAATVLTGFSWGGRITQFYTATFPYQFAGAVVGGSREYLLPNYTNPTRYAIFIGAEDFFDNVDRPARTLDFVGQMRDQGSPVWYYEITPGVGHWMVSEQINKVFEMINSLENR